MFGILLVLVIAVFVVHTLPQILPAPNIRVDLPPELEPPKISTVRLYDGPNNGKTQEIEGDLPSYMITPYVPTDDNGMPIPDEEHMFHAPNGYTYMKPSLAYYQQITEDEYVYVRDINQKELENIRLTGELPIFKKADTE